MRRVLAILAVALGLFVGGVTLPADTASAHQYDGYSEIYCTAHQSDYGVHIWVNHSWPYSLKPDLLTYRCTQYDTTVFGHPEHQYFVVRQMSTGAHWRQGGYQWCGAIYCAHH